MPQIIPLPPAVITAAKVIHNAELGWQDIVTRAANAQEARLKLEAALFYDPSEKNLAALVAFDKEQETIAGLRTKILGGALNPARLIGERLKAVLVAPLVAAIAELETQLATSIQEDNDLAEEHGMESNAGPRTRAVSERLAVARDVLRNVNDGTSSPLKVFARLGFALADTVDAEAMSVAALKSVRDAQRHLVAA